MNDNHKNFTIKITIPDEFGFNEEQVHQVVAFIQDQLTYSYKMAQVFKVKACGDSSPYQANFTHYPPFEVVLPFEVALIGRNLRNGKWHGCTCEITSL